MVGVCGLGLLICGWGGFAILLCLFDLVFCGGRGVCGFLVGLVVCGNLGCWVACGLWLCVDWCNIVS